MPCNRKYYGAWKHLDAPARTKYDIIEQRTSWTVPMGTLVQYLSSLHIVRLQLLQAKYLRDRIVMCFNEDERLQVDFSREENREALKILAGLEIMKTIAKGDNRS